MSNQQDGAVTFPGAEVMPHCGQLDTDPTGAIVACRERRPCERHARADATHSVTQELLDEIGAHLATAEITIRDLTHDRNRWKQLFEDANRKVESYERGHWAEFIEVCRQRDAAEAALREGADAGTVLGQG